MAAAISNLESRLAAASAAESSSAVAASLVNSIEDTSSTATEAAGAQSGGAEDGPISPLNAERRGSETQDVSMTSEPGSRAEENVTCGATPASGPTSFGGAATSTPRTEHVNDQVLIQKEFSHFSVLRIELSRAIRRIFYVIYISGARFRSTGFWATHRQKPVLLKRAPDICQMIQNYKISNSF